MGCEVEVEERCARDRCETRFEVWSVKELVARQQRQAEIL
jgi:hypothetical protein